MIATRPDKGLSIPEADLFAAKAFFAGSSPAGSLHGRFRIHILGEIDS